MSVAHLDDAELALDVVLEEVLTWVRAQPGSARLKALIVFDEVFGFIPPHPANPPTKRPLVALMSFGHGSALVHGSLRRSAWFVPSLVASGPRLGVERT